MTAISGNLIGSKVPTIAKQDTEKILLRKNVVINLRAVLYPPYSDKLKPAAVAFSARQGRRIPPPTALRL